jgi:hypothetical protein
VRSKGIFFARYSTTVIGLKLLGGNNNVRTRGKVAANRNVANSNRRRVAVAQAA